MAEGWTFHGRSPCPCRPRVRGQEHRARPLPALPGHPGPDRLTCKWTAPGAGCSAAPPAPGSCAAGAERRSSAPSACPPAPPPAPGGEEAKIGLWGSTHGALPVRALLQAGAARLTAARNGVKKPLQKSFAFLRRWEPGLECSACFGFPAGWICPLRC